MHRPAALSLDPPVMQADSQRAQNILAVLAVLIFAGLSGTLAVYSRAFLEGDACTHYIYARAALTEHYYLVDVWGRPFATALYAVPAHFGGRLAVRFTSLTVALVVALLSWRIARNQGWRWPVLALVFTLAQPLVFLHSFSELTELPFALLMTLGFWAYQQRRFFLLALVIGFAPTSRPEGFAFVALAAGALVLHRRFLPLLVLVLPLFAWDLTGWYIYGSTGHWWRWLAANWPYDKHSLYTPGTLWHYVWFLPAVTSPLIFPATLIGLVTCLFSFRRSANLSVVPARSVADAPALPMPVIARNRDVHADVLAEGRLDYASPTPEGAGPDRTPTGWLRRFFGDHHFRCNVLIAMLPMCILIGHAILYWRGALSSNGEIRYMLIGAPFWALLSARGWGAVFSTFNWRFPLVIAAIAAVLPAYVNRAYQVLPVVTMPDWIEAQDIADWYHIHEPTPDYPHVAITHPGVLYYLDISPTNPAVVEWRRDIIDKAPPGTILIWDRIGGMFNSDASRSIGVPELLAHGWTPMPAADVPVNGGYGNWHFFKSRPIVPVVVGSMSKN